MHEMIAYWLPKDGTALSDWEDGAAYSRASGWFAVADGASTGNNSREWAYTLASEFIQTKPRDVFQPSPTGFLDWVDGVRAGFDPQSDYFPRSKAPHWVQVAGSLRGSHATLLAGRLSGDRLEAVAVGDCCLFHLPATGRPRSFPLGAADEFGTSPALVSSHSTDVDPLRSAFRYYRQELKPDDVVLVASDALAEWLTKNLQNPPVWQLMTEIGHQGFGDLCRELRTRHQMKNDDVTLFRARLVTNNRGTS